MSEWVCHLRFESEAWPPYLGINQWLTNLDGKIQTKPIRDIFPQRLAGWQPVADPSLSRWSLSYWSRDCAEIGRVAAKGSINWKSRVKSIKLSDLISLNWMGMIVKYGRQIGKYWILVLPETEQKERMNECVFVGYLQDLYSYSGIRRRRKTHPDVWCSLSTLFFWRGPWSSFISLSSCLVPYNQVWKEHSFNKEISKHLNNWIDNPMRKVKFHLAWLMNISFDPSWARSIVQLKKAFWWAWSTVEITGSTRLFQENNPLHTFDSNFSMYS